MSASALHWLRHKQKPQGHPGNASAAMRKTASCDRNNTRPQNRDVGISRGGACKDAYELAAGAAFRTVDRGSNGIVILLRTFHHQLPDAPPPPDDPPPPPKAPPKPPPIPPPPHPEPQLGPP